MKEFVITLDKIIVQDIYIYIDCLPVNIMHYSRFYILDKLGRKKNRNSKLFGNVSLNKLLLKVTKLYKYRINSYMSRDFY